MFELQRYYSWIVDRFHLSTMAYQARQGREFDFGWLEERLKPLNFAIVLCTRPEDTFEQARAERLKISAKPDQYDSLEPFVEEQRQLRELAEKSILPVLELDVTRQGADDVADWLDEHGLLTL
jgi:thymidylate kinase